MKHLVIVESPAKAKTIEKYLGKDFTVRSSFGHIRDLPKKGMGIDLTSFTPAYEVSADKKTVVSELKKLAKTADTVWLATDEDREGEAIAWHLAQALSLPVDSTKRIVFHEITKPAIEHAVSHPRTLDLHLVDAQQARRVVDRLVGFELSPVLWKKVRTGLSAGRVQSVAVRLIVEREREIQAFQPQASFRLTASLLADNLAFAAKRNKDLADQAAAEQFLQALAKSTFTVAGLEAKPASRSPRPPFTTSTLQQEAAQKLGFSVKQTMSVAQRLYESGKITYMRTDSVNLSDIALGQAGNVIRERFGAEYHQVRKYKTKSAGAQEAHEAIRPTDLSKDMVDGERNEQRLYQLIWQRTLASQMSDAKFERTTAEITISALPNEALIAKGEVLLFDGFIRAYDDRSEDDDKDEGRLPPMQVGQTIQLQAAMAKETFSRPPARFHEAALVKALEEMGIGRPSTYAPTISTVQDRGYVVKEDREGTPRQLVLLALESGQVTKTTQTEITGSEKNKLFPTDIAGIVTDFLIAHFPEVIDYQFTARMEDRFDTVAEGKAEWRETVAQFYAPFHAQVEAAENISRAEVSQARVLGVDPVSGKPVSVRMGRFGAFAQLGGNEEETGEKPAYASLRNTQRMDTIKLEEALDLFKLPRDLGNTTDILSAYSADGTLFAVEAGTPLVVKRGPFGLYIQAGKLNVTLKGFDPLDITLEEASALVQAKLEQEANKVVKKFEGSDIQILNGQWGPYIADTVNKINAKIAKTENPHDLTLEECLRRLAETPSKPIRGRGKKAAPAAKKAASKTTTKKAAAVSVTSESAPKKTATKAKATTKKAASKTETPSSAAAPKVTRKRKTTAQTEGE
ncbi:MAG: type I DNA topoisomerase [Thiotrichales bacterium]|jgi:DNA topoisomerase-1|nr:type I DNA topoisomerase [Thiotrichales bacterium]